MPKCYIINYRMEYECRKEGFMKKKLIKILIFTVTIILLLGSSQVFALNTDYYKPDTLMDTNSSKFMTLAGKIFQIISTVGTISSVIIISIIGIKYMLGSVEEKAEYKKTAMTYFIGAVLLFSATTIPNILYSYFSQLGR